MTVKILVTGGQGYLGGRLCQFLSSDLSKEIVATTRRSVLSSYGNSRRISLVTLDVLGPKDDLLASCQGVDCIIHLAALNSEECAAEPLKSIHVNVLGTLRLLLAAKERQVRRFIYVSTAHVYGSPVSVVVTERTVPCPTHPYAISHRAAEDFVLASHDRKEIEGIVIRLSNGFGCPATVEANCWMLIGPNLCRQVIESEVIKLNTSGLQPKNFISLNEASRAISHLVELSVEQLGDGLFNVGGPDTLRIIDVAQMIRQRAVLILGKQPDIVRPTPGLNDTYPSLIYCSDKFNRTGFKVAGGLEEEIDRTLLFCQAHFAKSVSAPAR